MTDVIKTKDNVDVLSEFMQIDFPKRDWLLYPFIQEKGTAMLYARTGIGKTYMAMSIALAVSAGKSFLNFRVDNPHKVLYIDGEMAADEVKDRFVSLSKGMGINPLQNENLFIWTPDRQKDYIMPNLIKDSGQRAIDDFLNTNPVDLVILDNLSVLCNGIRENDAESWANFQEWLLSLRRRNFAVLEIQHAGKGGDYRGSSKQQDLLNYVVELKRPENHKKSDGARFEIHFEKTRGLRGDATESYEAQLQDTNDGGLSWYTSDIHSEKADKKQSEKEKVLALSEQRLTQQEIADEMELSIGKVNKLLRS